QLSTLFPYTTLFRSCSILLTHYLSEQMSDDFSKEEVHDTLPEQIRRAENFLVAHMRRTQRINRLEREEKLEYPRAAIREVIVNADRKSTRLNSSHVA